jgi:methyltransferase (TIGR00027 family)
MSNARALAERREKPNFSAENTAAARALSASIDRPPVRNPDALAAGFLGWKFTVLLRVPPLRRLAHRSWQRLIPGIVGYLNARTHHIDAALKAAVEGGTRQVLILGAGYDTRAYRLVELAGIPVFEVDQSSTQARKLRLLAKAVGPAARRDVHNVSADVLDPELIDVLIAEGLDRDLPTFVIFEGLSYYLRPDEHDALLEALREGLRGEITIVFDYLYQEALDRDPEFRRAYGAIAYLEKKGQPYRFGIPRAGLAVYVKEHGFEVVSDFSPTEMEDTYLRYPDGELAEPAFFAYGMALVRRPASDSPA